MTGGEGARDGSGSALLHQGGRVLRPDPQIQNGICLNGGGDFKLSGFSGMCLSRIQGGVSNKKESEAFKAKAGIVRTV